ncbi:hypothetical protein DWB84_00540 [Saccharophagus sp. K07]|uniref:oligosaccharide flippase family protein n=1 Tax=Saccharophagus sp. K07 TaxID=2283636 RepID=UPI001651FA24|nr:oligosaccharide flippase family protein [Saccharophagus sp. K07]MBC6903961.1 hypothetical protein [Saccharophagus sp. K07]
MLTILKRLRQGSELKRRIYSGSFWIAAGFGSQKALQLVSNLILTRLLFPEAFGLMALVNVFVIASTMFSDLGIRPAIIQAKNATNPDFLNTAWTMQIIRGFVLWIALCLLAYPASRFYGEDLLFPLLCFCGFSAVISGFRAVDFVLAERELKVKQIMIMQLIGQVVCIISMIVLALILESVWALAIGSWVGCAMELLLGHVLLKDHKHRLCWDPAFAKQIFHFGKWVFWSTIFTFFSGQGVRLIEGHFVSTTILAMIAIAGTIAWIFGELVERFMSSVLFPTLSRVHREDPNKLQFMLIRLRTILMAVTIPMFGIVSLLSVFIIEILYDDRYAFAGQVLTILAINGAIRTLPQIYQNALLAQGKTRIHFFTVCTLATCNILGLIIGYHVAGIFGMLIGSGLGYLTGYAITLAFIANSGWISIKWELLFLLLIAGFAAASFSLNLDQSSLASSATASLHSARLY